MGLAMSVIMLSNEVQLDRLLLWYNYRGSLLCVYGLVAFFLGWIWTGSPYYDSWYALAAVPGSLAPNADQRARTGSTLRWTRMIGVLSLLTGLMMINGEQPARRV